MKRSLLVAALTAFLLSLSLQTSEAQIIQFQRCGTCSTTCQRPRLFPRLFGFWAYPNYQATTASRGCVGGSCSLSDSGQNEADQREAETQSRAEARNKCAFGACPVADPQSPTCSDGSCSTGEYIPTEAGNVPVESQRLIDIVNRTRARYGLRALTFDAVLERGALYQANVCRSYGALIHASGVAEILAQNASDFDGAIRQWLSSPAHFAILTSGRYTRCGIGQVRDGYGRTWYAVQFR